MRSHLLQLHDVRVQQALVVHDLPVRVLHVALSAAETKKNKHTYTVG